MPRTPLEHADERLRQIKVKGCLEAAKEETDVLQKIKLLERSQQILFEGGRVKYLDMFLFVCVIQLS